MDSVLQHVADAPTLTYSLSTQWLSRVDGDISDVKSRIHDRIGRDKDTFDRQLFASQSTLNKLASLTRDVDELANAVADPKGIIAGLTQALVLNGKMQQEALDTLVLYNAVTHLHKCVRAYHAAEEHSNAGRLSDAKTACLGALEELSSCPDPLRASQIVRDLTSKLAAKQHSIQERLLRHLEHCVNVRVPQRQLIVRSAHQQLSLQEICNSIDINTLSSYLNTLRKNISTHFVEPVLRLSFSVTVDHSDDLHTLSVHATDDAHLQLQNLTILLQFVRDHCLPSLPRDASAEFAASLYEPFASAVLRDLLEPSLPSSLSDLPAFIATMESAVLFESTMAKDFCPGSGKDCILKNWVQKLPATYEKQRRQCFLDDARTAILTSSHDSARMDVPPSAVGIEAALDTKSEVNTAEETLPLLQAPDIPGDDLENAWEFDADKKSSTSIDTWGFEDEDGQDEPEDQQSAQPETLVDKVVLSEEDVSTSSDWGWDDDEPAPEDTATVEDDDPWESSWADSAPSLTKPPTSAPAQVENFATLASPSKPKSATRLEKKFAKTKAQSIPITPLSANPVARNSFSNLHHSVVRSEPVSTQLSPALPALPASKPATKLPVKETFLVSQCAVTIYEIVEKALTEGKELATSSIFDMQKPSRGGATLLQSVSSVLDLFRALLPIKDDPSFGGSTTSTLMFSNDCFHLAYAVSQLSNAQDWKDFANDQDKLRAKELMEDAADRLRECAEYWFENTLDKRREALLDVLGAAEGFVQVGDAEQFLECKMIVEQLVKDISRLAKEWTPILSKSSRQLALGVLVDGVLTEMINQIIRLDDIPEVESRNIAQLCRILNSLEDLFLEEPEKQSTIVVHVQSWLKFSYLSELLEASLTDISYLFDQSALIDFDTDELVRLIRALFADTPLRTSAIAKITGDVSH